MNVIGATLIAAIAALHMYIMFFEMFQWTSRGPRIFTRFPKELFEPTKPLAANQGLYNGFLATGLIWALLIRDPLWQTNIATCFLLFVLVAGIYGAATVSRRILFVQAIPAIAALLVVQCQQGWIRIRTCPISARSFDEKKRQHTP